MTRYYQKHGLSRDDLSDKLIASFETKIKKDADHWIWTGSNTLLVNSKSAHPARIAYVIFVGDLDITDRVGICCQEKTCVNPDHLKLNTSFVAVTETVKIIRKLWESGASLNELQDRTGYSKKQISTIARNISRKEFNYTPTRYRANLPKLKPQQIEVIKMQFKSGSSIRGLAKTNGISFSRMWELCNEKSSHPTRIKNRKKYQNATS